MKQLRYLICAIAILCCGASAALACDGDKASATNASASAGDCCSGHAKSASASCTTKGAGTNVSAAVARKGDARAATATCPMGGTMSAEQCKAMHASAASMDHCAKGASAAAKASCPMHGGNASTMAAARCELHGFANHADCVVCANEASCDDEVRATGARAQVVSLRNGAMIVYTADGAGNVRALQTAVARHNERVLAALSGKTDGELCAECKQLRGAMASGKFSREIVNVERGCQVLLTSSDRAIVQKIHDMTSSTMAARIKS